MVAFFVLDLKKMKKNHPEKKKQEKHAIDSLGFPGVFPVTGELSEKMKVSLTKTALQIEDSTA